MAKQNKPGPWVVLDKKGFVRKNVSTQGQAKAEGRRLTEYNPENGPYHIEFWIAQEIPND